MRYVIYFEPAIANLDDMDNRMSNRLESEVEDFLTAWRPEDAFDKQLKSHLWQFKWRPRTGSGARAYSGYFDGEHFDIALVLAAFKRKNASGFQRRQEEFNNRAKHLVGVLEGKDIPDIQRWFSKQQDRDDRRALTDENI
jgi:hypothetical protein